MFRPPKLLSEEPAAKASHGGNRYGIPNYNIHDVSSKTLIGQGAFGKVFKATYQQKSVVLKVLNDIDEKDIVKEARFLYHLKHENIVQFVGVSLEEHSLMLEYISFDFAIFGKETIVSNLEEFLHEMKLCKYSDFEHFPVIIANDIVNGVKYLHSKGVAHRDLKPSNVNTTETYVGLTENEFKTRYRNHTSSFRHTKHRHSTELSKYIWTLKDGNIEHNISWKILSTSRAYNRSSKRCNLCIKEKFFIICRPHLATLNKRNELVSACRHRTKALLIST